LGYTVAQKPPRYAARHRNEEVQNGNWRSLYNDAVVELDRIKLLERIAATQRAIGDRLEDASQGRNPIDANERQLIEDARYNLHFLKKHPAA
jgi:hypothetical protein